MSLRHCAWMLRAAGLLVVGLKRFRRVQFTTCLLFGVADGKRRVLADRTTMPVTRRPVLLRDSGKPRECGGPGELI